MKLCERIWVGVWLSAVAVPLWSQADAPHAQPAPAYGTGVVDDTDNRMTPPPTVSGQPYPEGGTSQERSNYFRAGVAFTAAYSDNLIASTGSASQFVNDENYSVFPNFGINETTTRLRLTAIYAPGFTVYQHTSSLNHTDQNASINFQYRLSPHVTFSARDEFQESSSIFDLPSLGTAGSISGGIQEPNQSVIAPYANELNNFGNAGITYQFTANAMIGASGIFTNLHYLDSKQVPGLFDAASQGGAAFYAHRISKLHYMGVTYQYQRLLSYPAAGANETQTHAILFLYTLYASSKFSASVFGGPQYEEIGLQYDNGASLPLPASQSWHPQVGGSLNWRGHLNSASISYSHAISGGGGLVGAAKMDSVNASLSQQLTRTLSGSAWGGYTQNKGVSSALTGVDNGHTWLGTASLQQRLSERLNVQIGYTRFRYTYTGVAVFASRPATNREFISISYQFLRPLGR